MKLKGTKRRCEFQGGAGLPEKYRPKKPCLGEFEPTTWNQRNCEVCGPFAESAHKRAHHKRAYAANPEKFRTLAREYLPSSYRETDPKRYREMQDVINARQRAWRKTNPKQSAALSARYRQNNPQKAKESQAAYHQRLHQQAVFGKIFEKLKTKPVSWRLIVMLKLLDPSLTKADLRKFGGEEADLSDRQMTRILDQINAWLREFSRSLRVKTPGPGKPVN